MSLEEQISELFTDIHDNAKRENNIFDDNVKKIKEILRGKLDDSQTTIYLNWYNNICPIARDAYHSIIGGYFIYEEFQHPIHRIIFDIENKKK